MDLLGRYCCSKDIIIMFNVLLQIAAANEKSKNSPVLIARSHKDRKTNRGGSKFLIDRSLHATNATILPSGTNSGTF